MKKSCAEKYGDDVQRCLRQRDPCPCLMRAKQDLEACAKNENPDAGTGPVSLANEAVRNLLALYRDAPDAKTQLAYSEAIGQATRIVQLLPKLRAIREGKTKGKTRG
jgi:hypothetical protein